MPIIRSSFRDIEIQEGDSSLELSVLENAHLYNLTGELTLANNYAITPTGTPDAGTLFMFQYWAVIDLNGYTFSVMGENLSQGMLDKANMISAYYDGSAWNVFIYKDELKIPEERSGTGTTEITTSGEQTITFIGGQDFGYQILTGSGTITGAISVVATDGITDGSHFIVKYEATMDLNGQSVTILGESLSSDEVAGGGVTIIGYYDGSSWHTTKVSPFQNTSEASSFARIKEMHITTADGILTEFTLNHQLGRSNVSVTVWDDAENASIIVSDQIVDDDNLTIVFDDPPAIGETFTVIIVG